MMSDSSAYAVSIRPAPAPTTVTGPRRLVSKLTAFVAPLTPASASVLGRSCGLTEAVTELSESDAIYTLEPERMAALTGARGYGR